MFVSGPTAPPGGQTRLSIPVMLDLFYFLITKDICVALPGAKINTLEAS